MLLGRDALDKVFTGFGDLEQRVGSAGVGEIAREAGMVGQADDLTALDVFRLKVSGVAHATKAASSLLDDLTLALGNICVILDPDVVILGLDDTEVSSWLAKELRARLLGRIPHVPTILGTREGRHFLLAGVGWEAFAATGSILDLVETRP
jgi:predicted NBD/HSP70 family sugar kinase